jgi:Flp pilus assembly protein TadG
MRMKLLQFIWRNHDGSALIEGALVIPMLFILVLGVYEFSWYFYQQQLIAAGLRDAARYLARAYDDPANGLCHDSNGITWNCVTAAKNLATTATINGTGALRVSGWDASLVTIPAPALLSAATTFTGINTYAVTVSTNFPDQSLGFFGILGLTAPSISLSHQERIIGPG